MYTCLADADPYNPYILTKNGSVQNARSFEEITFPKTNANFYFAEIALFS